MMGPNLKRVSISGKNLEVYDLKTFDENRSYLSEDGRAAVEFKLDNGNTCVLPIRPEGFSESLNLDKCKPGYYPGEVFDFLKKPSTEDEMELYCPPEESMVDFSNINSMKDLIKSIETSNELSNKALEGSDNATIPVIKDTNSPTMIALKTAIAAKQINLDKYAERFGNNFPNDKRKLNDDDVTLFILQRYCERLDLNLDIVISDRKDIKAPNPMNKEIRANIVPGSSEMIITNFGSSNDYEVEDEEE